MTVLQFELNNYIKNKSYVLTTLILGIFIAGLLFLPHVFNFSGSDSSKEPEQGKNQQVESPGEEITSQMLYMDKTGIVDEAVLQSFFPGVGWQKANNEDAIRKAVEEEQVKAGFVVKSATEFDYYVMNKGMNDSNSGKFQAALTTLLRMNYCKENGLDYNELETMYQTSITINEQILGKDTMSNYWYCYALVILVFMMIIFYGVMIATSITAEKSNRSIEVLVTSTSPNSLLFGKVIAGAIAGVVQVGFILGLALISYQINREAWGGALDMILNIPTNVIVTFAFFGLGGYLFYAFLYGAIGALVSKTEDINKSSGGVQMVVMLVYFAVLFQLSNIDGIIMKVASFLPISSYSAMFARVAMGSVAPWEVVLSFVILVISVFLAGIVGAKIYRMGTLRYGNPIKLRNAIKALKQK